MNNNNIYSKASSCRVPRNNDWQFIAQNVGTRFIASANPDLSGENVRTRFIASANPDLSGENVRTRFTVCPLGIASAERYGMLVLEDGTRFEGKSFGYMQSQAGEVVFSTGMV